MCMEKQKVEVKGKQANRVDILPWDWDTYTMMVYFYFFWTENKVFNWILARCLKLFTSNCGLFYLRREDV